MIRNHTDQKWWVSSNAIRWHWYSLPFIFNKMNQLSIWMLHLEMRSSIFSITKFFIGLLCYSNFSYELQESYQRNKTDNFLHTKITRRFIFLIQNGHFLLCYIRIFSKRYYYEHTFMILAFIEVASSKNGIGVGGFMQCV